MTEVAGQEKTDRRAEILALATRAFVTHGYSGTSMSDLARAVGIQKASLYHHFASKQALFVACVTEGYAGAVQRLEALRDESTLSDPARLRTAMEEIYRVNLTQPVGRMAPLIAEVAATIPEVAEAFHGGFIARHYAAFTGMIEDGIARGSFAPLDVMGLRQMIFGPVIFMAMEREMVAAFAQPEAQPPVAAIRDSHIDLILRLLCGPSHQPEDGGRDGPR